MLLANVKAPDFRDRTFAYATFLALLSAELCLRSLPATLLYFIFFSVWNEVHTSQETPVPGSPSAGGGVAKRVWEERVTAVITLHHPKAQHLSNRQSGVAFLRGGGRMGLLVQGGPPSAAGSGPSSRPPRGPEGDTRHPSPGLQPPPSGRTAESRRPG